MSEKITNPIIRDLLKAAIIDEEAREALETQRDDCVKHLRAVLGCLDEHLVEEAHDKNVNVKDLCPCYSGEAKKAREFLEQLK